MTALEIIYQEEYRDSTQGMGIIVWMVFSIVIFVALTVALFSVSLHV